MLSLISSQSTMQQLNKKEIRREVIAKRDLLKNKIELDEVIEKKLKDNKIYKNSKNIFIYLGFGSEINTIKYVEDFLDEGKKIIIPYTDMKNKVMHGIEINTLDGLKKNKFGILEPADTSKIFNKEDIDLVIMPGVAFDRSGNRVGYGGGYYDKFLSEINSDIPTIALAYDIQILEEVPSEKHDIKVHMVITEKETIKCLKSK